MPKKIKLIWILIRRKTIIGKKLKPESGMIGKIKTKKGLVIGIKALDDQYTFIYTNSILSFVHIISSLI